MGIGAIIIMLAWPACAEDFWTNCEEAYAFCVRNSFHRDCAVWTHYGKPLSVHKWKRIIYATGAGAGTDFCKKNPWHMQCGQGGYIDERYSEICPIP